MMWLAVTEIFKKIKEFKKSPVSAASDQFNTRPNADLRDSSVKTEPRLYKLARSETTSPRRPSHYPIKESWGRADDPSVTVVE